MIFLYYDSAAKILYAFDSLDNMGSSTYSCRWDNIDSVTTDYEKKQIVAHELNKGKILEFPIGHTVLACQKTLND
jgi:hypothetical protein